MLHMVCNLFIKNKLKFLKRKLCSDTISFVGKMYVDCKERTAL